MKHRLFFLILIYIFLCSCLSQAQTTTSLTNEQKSWLAKANRYEKNGWIYLHIEGAPKERGFQHGYLLAKEIEDAIRIERKVWEYESAMEWSWIVAQGVAMFTAHIDSENLAEIEGIVEGMTAAGKSTSREELITYNGSIDLIGYWWPSVKDTICPNAPDPLRQSCSAFIATGSLTTDGRIVLGHNTWSDYYYANANIILDILPDKGHRMFMQASAGLIHSGTDFFITDAGLVGTETTISDFFPFDPEGVPEFIRMRRATQYASAIDEWCDVMRQDNNGGYANAWLIGDVNTNEIARLELGLKHVAYEKKKDGYFVGSNVAEDLKILRFETRTNEQDIKNPDVARRVRWKQLMQEHVGKIDLEKAKAFLSDHYDTYLNKFIPDSRTLCGHYELDSQSDGIQEPFRPLGAYDAKVVDARMAQNMSFIARWGAACGRPFDAQKFLAEHPQFDWMAGLLQDRPSQPWTEFKAGER
jgi:hypothetical protein